MKVINYLKTKNIIKVSPDETLSSGLSNLNSSHDAAFVFTQNDTDQKFIGVINPYHTLIKNSYPGNAKIEHALFHPPKLHVNYPISKVAQLMIESKIHYLPVFDEKDQFTGIVSARNLLAHFKDSPLFDIKIGAFLRTRNHPILTVYDDDLIAQAINLFKTHKVSKLVVINRDMKLKGVLAYYDLIQFLVAPKKKAHRGDRKGNQISFTHHKVKNFVKSTVLTLTIEDTFKDALSLILEKGIGSVIIVDEIKHPIGIITTREFLTLIARGKETSKIELVSRNLSQESRQILGGFFSQIAGGVRKIPNLARARLLVKEEKKGGVFKANLSLVPKRGKVKVIKSEGKNLTDVLKKVNNSKK